MDINSKLLNKFHYPINIALHLANLYRDMTDAEMSDIIESLGEIDLINHYSKYMVEIDDEINTVFARNEGLQNYRDLYNMRFKEKLTLKEIGERIGKSVERVRQKLAKFLRMLKSRTSVGLIIPAICSKDPFKQAKWYIFRKYGELRYFDDLRPIIGHRLSGSPMSVDRFSELVEKDPKILKIGRFGIAKYISDLQKELEEAKSLNLRLKEKLGIKEPTYVPAIPIEDMDFSVRTYNCLKRAGLDNLSIIADCSMEDIMRIRNLGKKSYDELIAKLKEYNIELPEEGY